MKRSLQHLIKVVNDLINNQVGIISLNDPIDTTTIQGKLMFNIFSLEAELFARKQNEQMTRFTIF